jgi:RNA polymerase sigma-70 factor (ECF subfamily)
MSASGSLEVSPLPDPRSEQEVIQLVLSGRPEYFYQLVQPYERRVYRVAYWFLRNQADAEDVAQEAVLKALRKLSSFRGNARFSTWLLRIAMNEARIRVGYCNNVGVLTSSQIEIADWSDGTYYDVPTYVIIF